MPTVNAPYDNVSLFGNEKVRIQLDISYFLSIQMFK